MNNIYILSETLMVVLYLLCEPSLVSSDLYNATSGTDTCHQGGVVCYNHGRCTGEPPLSNNSCICQTGYTGQYCEGDVRCGPLEMNHTDVEPRYNSYGYGKAVFYRCQHGYQFSNMLSDSVVIQKAAVCGADGDWDQLVPCVALCPSLASWRGYITDTSARKLGTVVRYTCWGKYPWYRAEAGQYQYRFKEGTAGDDEEHSTECTENGTWQPPIKECIEIDPDSEVSSCGRITGWWSVTLVWGLVLSQ